MRVRRIVATTWRISIRDVTWTTTLRVVAALCGLEQVRETKLTDDLLQAVKTSRVMILFARKWSISLVGQALDGVTHHRLGSYELRCWPRNLCQGPSFMVFKQSAEVAELVVAPPDRWAQWDYSEQGQISLSSVPAHLEFSTYYNMM